MTKAAPTLQKASWLHVLTFEDRYVKNANLEVSITRKLRNGVPWLRIPPAKYRPFLQLCVYKRKTRGTSMVGEKSVPAGYPLGLWSSSWKSLVPGIVDSLLCPFQ